MKSPAMNSPLPSMKKQRSASPSQAMPMSAFCLITSAVMSCAVLLDQRIRFVIGERAVDLEAQPRRLAGQPIEQPRRDDAGDAAAGVEDDVERLDRLLVDERHHVLDVAIHDVGALDRAGRRRRRRNRVGEDHLLHFLDAGFAAQRKRFLADHLAAVVLAGIVRRGDLRAAVEAVGGHGVVHLVGADQAVVDDRCRPA